MALYTDTPQWQDLCVPAGTAGRAVRVPAVNAATVLGKLFAPDAPLYFGPCPVAGWRHLIARGEAHASQFDVLVESLRTGARLPDRLACTAGSGSGLHGSRGRGWTALPGNIHLTAHFAPDRVIDRFEAVFTALAATAVAAAIESLPGFSGRVRIKWVNDVLVDDHKVAGVLAWTQTRGERVSNVVLGIGLNVETTPVVERSPFVPAAASLRQLSTRPDRITLPFVLRRLLVELERSWSRLLSGGPGFVMDQYRRRSAVVGREVTVVEDTPGGTAGRILAQGVAERIGDGLELYISGSSRPVTGGRLILGRPSS